MPTKNLRAHYYSECRMGCGFLVGNATPLKVCAVCRQELELPPCEATTAPEVLEDEWKEILP